MIEPATNPVNNSPSNGTKMQWVSALSTRASLEAALDEAIALAQQDLSAQPDLGLIFISSAFASEYSRVMPLLQEKLSLKALLGCSGGGIVGVNTEGQARELEGKPAISLTLACLPGVEVKAFHLNAETLPDLDGPPNAWTDLIGIPTQQTPHFILLSDPFSSKINDLLQGLDFAYPGSVKVGGLASSGSAMGNRTGLFANYEFYQEGTVGLALSGNVVMEAIVAQGCRPIGQPLRVTEGERNIVLGLEDVETNLSDFGQQSRTPLEVLRSILEELSEEDRTLAQNSLFVGIARNEFKQDLEQGDFLIRNLLGVDPRVGAIAVGDRVRSGQRIQFHLRDARTSAEDLELLMKRYQMEETQKTSSAVGALMFSCLGRGESLYNKPNFDAELFSRYTKQIPISGFFCNGEIGPVGGGTFLHGYTSVFGICRQP